jgi:hypothetical protein
VVLVNKVLIILLRQVQARPELAETMPLEIGA